MIGAPFFAVLLRRSGGDGMNLDLQHVAIDLGGREVVHDVSMLDGERRLARRARTQRGREVDVAARDRRAGRAPGQRGDRRAGHRDDAPPRARRHASRSSPQKPTVPEGATVTDYALLGRTPHIRYFGSVGRRRSTTWWPGCSSARPVRRRASAGVSAVGRRGPARVRRAGARAGAVAAAARRADDLARRGPSTGGARAHRVAAPRPRRDGGLGPARPLPRRPVRRPRCCCCTRGTRSAEGPPAEVLTEKVVREFFGAAVRLVPIDGSGHVLVPVRRRARCQAP